MSIELEKYSGGKSRHTCPECRKQQEFTRYIDTLTNNYIASHVGICNRKDKCGYHFTPQEYYALFGSNKLDTRDIDLTQVIHIDTSDTRDTDLTHFDTVSKELVSKTLDPNKALSDNNFVKYLLKIFSDSLTIKLICKFKIGTGKSNHTIFWQIDTEGNTRTGKKILYDVNTGKRTDQITYIHKNFNLNYKLNQCFFGLHQLQDYNKTVAIFESEKSAILMSPYLEDFICLSSGGANMLSLDKFKILKEKKCKSIILYPDKSFYTVWKEKAVTYSKALNIDISVSKVLELSDFTKIGDDLADHINFAPIFNWALSDGGYPVFWDNGSKFEITTFANQNP